eukprot:m.21322 g.21322  ORF g.21322 m.21322 type:complete len:247 (+) comp6376_c0_seq1:208-948(+)
MFCDSSSNGLPTTLANGVPVGKQQPGTSADPAAAPATDSSNSSAKTNTTRMGDGNYFIGVMGETIDRLQSLCTEYDPATQRQRIVADDGSVTEGPLSEENDGRARAAIGKAQLLITKRLPQFRGLCDLNLDPNAEKKATNEDLAGFWDLISLAIDDVFGMFEKLSKLREAGWPDHADATPKPSPKVRRASPEKKAKAKKAAPSAALKAAMAERRRAMREAKRQQQQKQQEQDGGDIAIFMPNSPQQ